MVIPDLLVVAHRGASGEAPENTLAAFRLALAQGCDAFELDVHLSRDGHLMVMHDEKVDRTTNGKGELAKLTLKELRKFDAGVKFHKRYQGEIIPTLEDVFDITPPGIQINVEIKGGEGIEEKLVDLLRRRGRLETVFVSSFEFGRLVKLNRLEPSLRVGLLYQHRPHHHALLPLTAGVRAYSLHPDYRSLDAQQVLEARAVGLAVFPWTVNKEKDMLTMARAGVSGIITNYPGRLRRLLDRLKSGTNARA